MPSYERELDLVQGYNFKKDVQKPIGFITALTIGTSVVISPDQIVSTPINDMKSAKAVQIQETTLAAGSLKVVSVLKKIKWDLGDVDPIEFEGTLSVTGKQLGMSLLYATLIDINVSFSYIIYEYDPLARQYFIAFSNLIAGGTESGGGKPLSGLIKKDGDALKFEVSPSPSAEVQSPENYEFKLTVSPQAVPQPVYLAAASTRRVTKTWGRQGPTGTV